VSTESLGAFVRRIRTEKNLSCADVSKRSTRKGQRRIAASYVNRIENNPKLRVTADRLKALADGLDVPADEVLARAAGIIPLGKKDSDEFRLLTRFRELSRQRKDDLLTIIDALYLQEIS
jgi:transcriptional regulator with XRE-family HTH domain